jgi:acetyl esterase/lipase
MTHPARLIAALLIALATRAAFPDDVKIERDVVYGHKDGMALTFDVLTPASANGAAILHIQSGGWYSRWAPPEQLIPMEKPFLDAGYVVFIVRHGSAPRYQTPDAVADVRRSVRFIRLHAEDYGVDPERLGATGGSAGGHLTLMLATTGDDGDNGDAASADPVLKASSRIAAGVAIFPPTDLRGWTTSPPAEIAAIPALGPPLDFDASLEADVSPILHVSKDDAPVLLIHGDQDKLVPIEHSRKILPVLQKSEVESELITIEGAGHGFSREQNVERVLPAMLKWFDEHLDGEPIPAE